MIEKTTIVILRLDRGIQISALDCPIKSCNDTFFVVPPRCRAARNSID